MCIFPHDTFHLEREAPSFSFSGKATPLSATTTASQRREMETLESTKTITKRACVSVFLTGQLLSCLRANWVDT